MAYPSNLIRTKNWGNEVLTDADLEGQLDLIIDWVMAAQNASTGHKHDATSNEGPKILTANIDDSTGNQGEVYFSSGTAISKLAVGSSGQVLTSGGAAADPTWETNAGDQSTDGSVIQVVNNFTTALVSATTAIPLDDTIPQNTEGDEVITKAITPGSTTNKLKIEVSIMGSPSDGGRVTAALFQDSTANALACSANNAGATDPTNVSFVHYMTAGTASSTTFKVRVGAASGTVSVNGDAGSRQYGGVCTSSITITEIKAS